MPDEFPKLGLDSPKDLDHVLSAISDHAIKTARLEFGTELDSNATLKSAVETSIQRWTTAAKTRVERNLLFNGMTLSEYSKHSKAVEPFDEELSRKVQSLAEQSDRLTEEVIAYRKTLPSRRANAMQKRAQVIRQLEDKKERQRRKVEQEDGDKMNVDAEKLDIVLERKDQIKNTLQQSVKDITGLQVSILEQATTASEQTRLVKRLRTMPPS